MAQGYYERTPLSLTRQKLTLAEKKVARIQNQLKEAEALRDGYAESVAKLEKEAK